MKQSLKPETDLNIKSINEIKPEVAAPVDKKSEAKARWEALQQEESKVVKGKFVYHECPGGTMEFTFRKYKNTPLINYSLKDGEIYEVPLAVARHLNTNVSYPVHGHKKDEAGKPVQAVQEMIRRTSFQSLDFY